MMTKNTLLTRTLWSQSFVAAAVLGTALSLAGPALAEVTDFKSFAQNLVNNQLVVLPDFISAVCYIIGIVFIAQGVMRLKEHADNPNSAKLPPALGRLLVGGAIVSLPVLAAVVQKSMGIGSTAATPFKGFGVPLS